MDEEQIIQELNTDLTEQKFTLDEVIDFIYFGTFDDIYKELKEGD